MGTKMAVAFANIFMADIEPKMISQSKTKPIEWKRFIDDIFSLWDSDEKGINLFIEQANKFHPTIKFTQNWKLIYVHTKSAFAEKHIQKSANYILQERTIS